MFLNFKDNIPFYLLSIIFIAIPIGGVLLPIGIILWVLSLLFYYNKDSWKKNFLEGWAFYLPAVVFFLMHLMGLIWTDNIDNGLSKIEQKLSFLVIPLFFPFLNLSKYKGLFLFKLFSLSCLFIVIISF